MSGGDKRYGSSQSFWIDWYTVTYRRLAVIALLLIVILAYPSYLVYEKYWGLTPEERRVSEAIHVAEQLFDRASRVKMNRELQDFLNRAGSRLGEAREAYDRSALSIGYDLAIESGKLSNYILDSAGSERSPYSFKVFDVEGDVRVKRKNSLQWEQAVQDMALEPKDKVQTGDRGSALLFAFDGSLYELKPNSLIEIQKSAFNPVTREKDVEVNVSFGFLDLSTSSRSVEGSSSKVSTPSATSSLSENSHSAVNYDVKSGETSVYVYDGTVNLKAGGEQREVGKDKLVTVASDQTISSINDLPVPPKLVSPPHLRPVFIHPGQESVVELKWLVVQPECRYHLQIASHSLFANALVDRTDMHEDKITVRNLAPGEYYWHVSSISPQGVKGKYSQTYKFEVKLADSMPDRANRKPPRLTVETPLSFGNIALVEGITDAGVLLSINSDEADVESDGSFRHLITLPDEGINRIEVVAQDASGLTTTKLYEVDVTLP